MVFETTATAPTMALVRCADNWSARPHQKILILTRENYPFHLTGGPTFVWIAICNILPVHPVIGERTPADIPIFNLRGVGENRREISDQHPFQGDPV